MSDAALSITTAENRSEIERRIQDMKNGNPGLSYVECRNAVRHQAPELFGLDAAPVVANRAMAAPSLADTARDEVRAGNIADAIAAYRNEHPACSYTSAREAVRSQNPELFS